MYFFDLEDYRTSRIIGKNNVKLFGDWEDEAGTARETRNAYIKAFHQWYLSSTTCFNEEKMAEVNSLYSLIRVDTPPYYGPKTLELFDKFQVFINMMNGINDAPNYTAETTTSYGTVIWSGHCFDYLVYQDYVNTYNEFNDILTEIRWLVEGNDYGRNPKYMEESSKICYGCEYIDLDEKLTTELSQINNVDEFRKAAISELIDVKNRKTLSAYPTLNLLYDRYLGNCGDCETNKFTYKTMDGFINVVGKHWIDLAEQFVPSTTIWGATDVVRNSIFHQQKHRYRKTNLVFSETNNVETNNCNIKGFHLETIDYGNTECVIYDVTFQEMPKTLAISATSIDYQSNVDFEGLLVSNPSNPIQYNLVVGDTHTTFGKLTEDDLNTISANNENSNKETVNNPFAINKKYAYRISSGPAFCNPTFLGSIKITESDWVRARAHWDYFYNRS